MLLLRGKNWRIIGDECFQNTATTTATSCIIWPLSKTWKNSCVLLGRLVVVVVGKSRTLGTMTRRLWFSLLCFIRPGAGSGGQAAAGLTFIEVGKCTCTNTCPLARIHSCVSQPSPLRNNMESFCIMLCTMVASCPARCTTAPDNALLLRAAAAGYLTTSFLNRFNQITKLVQNVSRHVCGLSSY